MVVMLSVASPGGGEEGGQQLATEANQNARHQEPSQEPDDDYEDEFKPLIIDTLGDKAKMSAMQETEKKEYLRQQMALYMENNPSDVEENAPSPQRPQEVPVLSNTPNTPQGAFSDTSTPSGSRVNSPALSTTSNSGGSLKSKLSQPQKARRKTDKILPVDESGEKFACPICQKILVSNTELTKHIRSHNNGAPVAANTCTICGKVLSSQSSLDRHMLVHSGERPFKCKYCKMAFTTNGNMHRHTRIHEKEGAVSASTNQDSSSGRSNGRQSRAVPDLDTPYSQVGFTSPLVKQMRELTPSGSKRKLPFEESYLSQFHAPKRSPFHPPSMTGEYLLMSPDGRAVQATTPSPPRMKSDATVKLEGDMSGQSGEYSCPSCPKKFVCRFAMETHLATHPDVTFRCSLCPRSFTSTQELNLHKLDDHHWAAPASDLGESDAADEDSETQPKGFQHLSFTDFTLAKFPLIAQAWCDKNNRQASSAFHDFTCTICKKAFPCQSALNIHKNVHAPENMNECKNCHACFTDGKALADHMLNHTACKVVARVALSEGAQDKPQDIVSQEEFMASFGLKIQCKSPSSLSGDEEKMPADESRGEARINTDYYPILKQMAELHKRSSYAYGSSMSDFMRNSVSRDSETCNDFADIQQILSRFGGGPVQIEGSDYHSPSAAHLYKQNMSLDGPNVDRYSKKGSDAESDISMKLPVMVENGFVPIQHKKDGDESGEIFQCKYCPDTFNNYRVYKSHIRTHQGLSPYKCNLCSYSSADKSTLIRHLRTHNGERPFQCRICEFAFTTKANCERHVRKKHFRTSKKDIEDSIGYNQYATESQSEESFGSPDTVCKFCGEDFKFFRALKHHLRTHISCALKPFLCKICNNGFSTKANVMRHIQKQHTEVEERLVEEHIHVNEHLAEEYENYDGMDRAVSPASSTGTNHHTGTSSDVPIVISPIPHLASSMHVPAQPLPFAKTTYITSPPIIDLAREATKTQAAEHDDQPLDFSMKASPVVSKPIPVNPITIEPHHMSGGQAFEQATPMDLTMKPSNIEYSAFSRPNDASTEPSILQQASPKVARSLSDLPPDVASRALPQLLVSPSTPDYGMLRYKKEYQKFYNASVGRLQCPYCKMLFKHGLKLQVHIRSHTNERPFSCFYCSASFTIKTNLERHLKTRHPKKPAYIPDVHDNIMPASEESQGKDLTLDEEEFGSQAKRSSICSQSLSTNSFNGSDDSSCELSSVNKILDVTNSNHFRGFLSAASEQDTSELPSQTSTPFTHYQDKDEELDMDEDSDGDGEVITVNTRIPDSETIIQHTADSLPIIKIRNPKVAEKSDDPSSPAKKKRNSYADSPHKLMCPYCPRAFPWISSLNRHILTHTGQKPFKCPQCPVMFSTKSNRERHLVRKHGLNVLDPMTRQMMDRPYKCHLCVFSSFSTAGNLIKHYTEKHPEVPIPEHLTREASEDNNTANDAYTTECHENSRAAEANNAKRLDFGDEDEDGRDDIQDGLGQKLMDQVQPGSKLTNGNSSRATTPTLHDAPSPEPTPPSTPDRQQINPEKDNYNADKITECWKCFLECGTRKALLRHLKDHNIDLPFKCYLCDASYDNRLESLEHTNQRHPQDWTMLRDKNQVTDINEFADCMNRIVEQNFIGNNNYGKKLTEAEVAKYKVQLLEDMKPESDYVQRKVYCSLCPKRFWSLQDLRRHMRSHTGERPFVCDICHKRFTLKHSMMRHRRKHTDISQSPVGSDDEMVGNLDVALHRTALIEAHKNRALAEAMSPSEVPSSINQVPTPSRSSVLSGLAGGLFGGLGSDMLHNLLGVDDNDIDEMITSGSADQAARVLGVDQ